MADDDGFFSIDQLLLEEGLDATDACDADDEGWDGDASVHNNTASDFTETELENLVNGVKPELTMKQKRLIVDNLLALQKEGKLPWGSQSKVARQLGVHRSTVCRIYRDAKRQSQHGNVVDVRQKKCGRVGRKAAEYSDEFLQSVPLNLRTSVRAFAGALKVPPSTVWKLLKRGRLRSHTSPSHPKLTEDHKLLRMKWVLGHIIPATHTEQAQFVDMDQVVHIDEKWFYMSPDTRRFYLLPFEDDPYRCSVSKRYKIKVMFIAVTSRPVFDANGNCIHDGKLGIFPFVQRVAAKHKSKNRPAGTIETKAIEKVTQPVIRKMLTEKVVPCIMDKWPSWKSKQIHIQQDNARPHISDDDPLFREAASQNGFDMHLIYQPPQSPDLNVLDLGLFKAFQSIQYQSFPNTIDELIEKTEEAFYAYDPQLLKYAWLTLQYVMIEILKCKGGNHYKLPHQGKRRMERLGILPYNVQVDQEIVDEAVAYLNETFVQVPEDIQYHDMEVDQD